jgi:diacylglycerol diphosphate phosphatase / phosphatidate phosphatase
MLAAFIPLETFFILQIWIQSFVDFGAAVLGLGYSLVTGTCIQIIIKKTIGGFRPHFLAVCKPVIPPDEGQGFGRIMYSVQDVCTTTHHHRLSNALESFPSGHAEIAFAAFGYLAIYLFTHLKITSRQESMHTRSPFATYWRMVVVLAPIVFATYLSATLVTGHHHFAHDVFFGAFIGAACAMFGYRMAFKGIVDPEWNTVPYLNLEKKGRKKGSDAPGSNV